MLIYVESSAWTRAPCLAFVEVKASGVGLDEHVEARRLGRLFDEWVAKKQDVDAVYAELGLATPREGYKLRPSGSPTAAARRPRV